MADNERIIDLIRRLRFEQRLPTVEERRRLARLAAFARWGSPDHAG